MMVALLAERPHRRSVGRQSENSPRVLVPQTLVLTKRLLLRWGRDLSTVLQTLIVPILLLVTVDTVLGRQITSITGHDALYGSVPMVAVVATISGSSVGALGLVRERADGLLARLWALPVHRASGLLSRFVAEAVRILVTSSGDPGRRDGAGVPFPTGRRGGPGLAGGSGDLRACVRHPRHGGRVLFGDNDIGRGHRAGQHARHLLLHRVRTAGAVSASGSSRWSSTSRCHMPSMRCADFSGRTDRVADDGHPVVGRRHRRRLPGAHGARLSKGEYAVMFSTSVIRKLAPSEEMFAQSQTFFGGTVHLRGPVDVDAMCAGLRHASAGPPGTGRPSRTNDPTACTTSSSTTCSTPVSGSRMTTRQPSDVRLDQGTRWPICV